MNKKLIKNKNIILYKNKKMNKDIINNDNEIKKISKTNKQKLGQFFTTNYKYILSNLSIPDNVKKIIQPFCSNGDLLNFFDKNKYTLECYDIEPKYNLL